MQVLDVLVWRMGATDISHMTSPWQHHMSMCIIWQNGKSDTPTLKIRCTHPQLNCCPDNTKRTCHHRWYSTDVLYHLWWPKHACSKVEWIYTWTKVSGHGSLELALENRRKERKIDKINGYFLNIRFWFWHIQLLWWMILVSIDR